ncbi:hypothetical protein QJQ45_022788, partial [Haematococcus lacustris]
IDEGSLAASTQLTKLDGINWFPGLTQLTQLQHLDADGNKMSSNSLPLLAMLTQLAVLRLQSCQLCPSSQQSRFLFQHLTSLTVNSIHSRDLAALDCPQLQTLAVHELLVDCAASLRACASGILQHCCDVSALSTYNHGQEFKSAAAGAEVRQLGPPPSTSALLEALAPWQPRSGMAIEKLGLWHLPDVTRKALEWLPGNIKSLTFQSCHLLPGALSSVATRLTQLTRLDLSFSHVSVMELQLLAARAQQGASLTVYIPIALGQEELASLKTFTAYTHSWTGHTPIVIEEIGPLANLWSPASPLPSNPLARGPPQPSPLPTPLAQLSSTCLVQLLWAFASHEHCQAALLRAAAPVLSARILQGQLSSRRVACVAWAYARLQQLEPRLVSAILRHSMAHAEQYELRYWARLAWAFSTLGLASEEAYHQRLARLMQERQQQLQRPTPAAGAVAAAQRPSRLQQRGRGHTAALAARPGAGQGPRVGLEAMRLVCKQLRAAIDVSVNDLGIDSLDSDDPDEVLQRLARTSLRPGKLNLDTYSATNVAVCRAWQRLPQLSSLTLILTPASYAAAATPHLKGLEHITSLRSLDLTQSRGMVDEGSLAACTQLTALRGCRWFPALTQLIQLQQLYIYGLLSSDSLPLLATLPQLADLKLQSCPLQPSSQLSRFLFQNLTSLTVYRIHSRDLAALDCPQLQTLAVRQLLVDCAASLHVCANGILQHCNAIYELCTYNHGQEFEAAAAGAGVRKAIEILELWHLSDVTREALEWLPVNIKSLHLGPSSSLDSCDDLLPRSSAASLLQQLGWVEGDEEAEDGEPRSASFTWVLLAWAFARARYHHHQLYDKLGEAVLQGLQGSHLMPRLQQASRAAPPHPSSSSSSSSSSVAATHSSPASPLPSNPLARGPPQPSPLPTPLAQLSSTCLVQLLWAFASHEHCQAALLRAAAPVLSARILQGQLSSRRVACVAWAYARLQQLEPRLVSAILRHSMAHAEQYELRYWARLAWALSTLGLASEEAYHQRLARLMQERQQQLQRPTPAAGAVAAAQRPSRLQQRGRGHTAAPAARPGAGQGPRVGLECADEQDWMGRSRAQSQLLLPPFHHSPAATRNELKMATTQGLLAIRTWP